MAWALASDINDRARSFGTIDHEAENLLSMSNRASPFSSFREIGSLPPTWPEPRGGKWSGIACAGDFLRHQGSIVTSTTAKM
jgi:hypothetical protein